MNVIASVSPTIVSSGIADDSGTRLDRLSELARDLLARARAQGAAIALAHPRPATLAALAEEIPRAVALGFEFVPVSYLLERSEDRQVLGAWKGDQLDGAHGEIPLM